jgi:hypothetical protein
VGTQWRSGFSGVIGLDYTAVYRVADSLGIDMDTTLLHKIAALEHEILSSRRGAGEKAPPSIAEYCTSCANAKRNIDCHICDVTRITRPVNNGPEQR